MKQLKPFTFWIVAGVIVLVELGFLIFYVPTDSKDQTPEVVKAKFDKAYEKLQGLYKQATHADPIRTYSAESEADIKELTEDYLLTNKWIEPMKEVAGQYSSQLETISDDLVRRSHMLTEPVYDLDDADAWYDKGYFKKSDQILKDLVATNGLADADEHSNLGDDKFRQMLGFRTKTGGNYPDKVEHALLTTRFNIIKKIAETVIATKVKVEANPLLGLLPGVHIKPLAPDALLNAQIVSLNFSSESENQREKTTKVVVKNASGDIESKPYDLKLILRGTVGTLIACEGAIEDISEPVIIVRGGSLGSQSSMEVRKGEPLEQMYCTLNIRVMAFTKGPKTVTPPVPGKDARVSPPGQAGKGVPKGPPNLGKGSLP